MNETVLVTGVARGIGRAITDRLLQEGYAVAGIDIEPDPPAGMAAFEQADLADPSSARQALNRLTRDFAFTRLVNNVGTSFRENVRESTGTTQRRMNRLNVASALLCLQAVLPAMRNARFGRIVNLTSRAVHGRETRSAYSASKASLAALTKTWALELAQDGIAVNAVAPGMINTDLFRRNNPPDSPDVFRLRSAIPMGRVGEPQDVAGLALLLCSDAGSYITGDIIHVDGGMCAR